MYLNSQLSSEQLQNLLQNVSDLYADESTDEKRILLFGLSHLRFHSNFVETTYLILPDPTPISLSHHTETFSQFANK